MTLQEGFNILSQISNKPFGELFVNEDLSDIIDNKGRTGQLVEKAILHLKLSSAHLDFSDGELKSNKSRSNGTPVESLAICMASSIIDELNDPNFDPINNYVMNKINNWIYLGVNKDGDPSTWFCFAPLHISRDNEKYVEWYKRLDNDFQFMRQHIYNCCISNKLLCTSPARNRYIQIRTKGAGHDKGAIFSKRYNRYVSDKSYGIYLTKTAIKDLLRLEG